MRARDPILFLLGAASACAVMALWPSRGPDGPGPSGARVADTGAVEQAGRGARTGLPLSSEGDEAGRAPIAREQRSDPVAPPGADGVTAAIDAVTQPLPRAIPTDEELEARFGQLDLAQLDVARKAIGWARHLEAGRLLEAKMENGQYRTDVVPAGYEIEGPEPYEGDVSVAGRTDFRTLENGMMEIRRSEVHPDESFALQVHEAEFVWLGRRIALLKKREEARRGRESGG